MKLLIRLQVHQMMKLFTSHDEVNNQITKEGYISPKERLFN